MEDFDTSFSVREIIKDKLRQNFDGKIVPQRPDEENQGRGQMYLPMFLSSFLGSIAALTMMRLLLRALKTSNAFLLTTMCVRMNRKRYFPSCVSVEL